jgi:DNA-binding response OmpR family regulator
MMGDAAKTTWKRLSDPLRVVGNTGSPATSIRILIVDAHINASSHLETRLRTSGYSQIRVAYSAHAALAIVGDFDPSVVLIELNLLDMSGYELARLLRERRPGLDMRLMAMTSSREQAGPELARVRGFECYLIKPVVDFGFLNGPQEY